MTDGAETAVVTETCSVSAGDYLRELVSLWLPRNWWMIVLPPLPFVALCAFTGDLRWAMVALMVIFIVLPMLLSLLYFWHMLAPEVRLSLLPHTAEISREGIRILYSSVSEDYTPKPDFIPASGVRATLFRPRFLVYRLRGRGLTVLLIPYTALPQGVSRAELTL